MQSNQYTAPQYAPFKQLGPQETASKPLEYGITSAINDLRDRINAARMNAADLRGNLGIGQPLRDAPDSQEPCGLANILRAFSEYITQANMDLQACLLHIQS